MPPDDFDTNELPKLTDEDLAKRIDAAIKWNRDGPEHDKEMIKGRLDALGKHTAERIADTRKQYEAADENKDAEASKAKKAILQDLQKMADNIELHRKEINEKKPDAKESAKPIEGKDGGKPVDKTEGKPAQDKNVQSPGYVALPPETQPRPTRPIRRPNEGNLSYYSRVAGWGAMSGLYFVYDNILQPIGSQLGEMPSGMRTALGVVAGIVVSGLGYVGLSSLTNRISTMGGSVNWTSRLRQAGIVIRDRVSPEQSESFHDILQGQAPPLFAQALQRYITQMPPDNRTSLGITGTEGQWSGTAAAILTAAIRMREGAPVAKSNEKPPEKTQEKK